MVGAIVYLLHPTLTGYSNWSTHISVNVCYLYGAGEDTQ